jgi:thiamine pyrophosphokinase
VNPNKEDHAVVVAGGDPCSGPLPRIGPNVTEIIAADSGVDLAIELGLAVSVVIGDMDSASPEALAEAERYGARIERHPEDKDATDLELAMDLACANGATNIVVLGGAGGRMSHLLGIAALLAGEKYAHIGVSWLLPTAEIHVINSSHPVTLDGAAADLVSLIPIGCDAEGIRTTGLRWTLAGDTLSSAATRGISNELVADRAEISVTAGTILVVHEGSQK